MSSSNRDMQSVNAYMRATLILEAAHVDWKSMESRVNIRRHLETTLDISRGTAFRIIRLYKDIKGIP